MPKFTKSPPALVQRFEAVAGRHPEATSRQMFGYPAMFVGGNLVTGLFEDRWMVRLGEAARVELLALPDAAPFTPMPGRTMTGYAVLPRAVVDDDRDLERWVGEAIAFGRTLPAK